MIDQPLPQRLAARLLVLDPEDRLLLFRFQFDHGPLAGTAFWATPGGELEPGEDFAAAAVRELFEETGVRIDHPGPEIARREARFTGIDGAPILADERFFLVRVTTGTGLSRVGWTALERQVMTEHRWWTLAAVRQSPEQIWPEGLADLVEAALR